MLSSETHFAKSLVLKSVFTTNYWKFLRWVTNFFKLANAKKVKRNYKHAAHCVYYRKSSYHIIRKNCTQKLEVQSFLRAILDLLFRLRSFIYNTEFGLSSSVVTVGRIDAVRVLPIIPNEHAITLIKKKMIAIFQFLSPQDKDFIEKGCDLLALRKMKCGEVLNGMNQISQVSKMKSYRQPSSAPPGYEKIWLPTPKTCHNPENLPLLRRKTYDNLAELQQRNL